MSTPEAIANYMNITDRLLQKHFGISVNDVFMTEHTVNENIANNIAAWQLVNEFAEEDELVRVDKEGLWGIPTFIPLEQQDQDEMELRILEESACQAQRLKF